MDRICGNGVCEERTLSGGEFHRHEPQTLESQEPKTGAVMQDGKTDADHVHEMFSSLLKNVTPTTFNNAKALLN